MITYYLQIKLVHILAVLASGGLFAVRGAALLGGQRWPMAAVLRYLSYSIDTVLLTAALMLLTILPAGVFANGWLLMKLFLLVVYVVLGSLALKRGRSAAGRRGAYAAALLTYIYMLGVARMHHPLGWLQLL